MASKNNLGKLIPVPLRAAWEHEASDFTPWLAGSDNLNELAEALGLSELALVATEHWIGDFKLDILCTDGEDQVIIENQLAETDHKHLGQLLSYAAGAGAKKVIWIAESFRPEHAAALAYLNENSSEELAFFGVQVELWRIGDSPLAPKFEVVVKPSDWARASRRQTQAASDTSPTKQLQQRFWQALIDRLKRDAPELKPQAARQQHWVTLAIGRSGFQISATSNTRDGRLGVELYIHRDDDKQALAALRQHRAKVETDLGFALDWQELPDSRASRVVTYLEKASLADQERWPQYLDWLVPRIVAMDRVFRPLVKALP